MNRVGMPVSGHPPDGNQRSHFPKSLFGSQVTDIIQLRTEANLRDRLR
jgi:hypothetical protein